VGDEQVGEAKLLLEVFQQVDHLRLDGDIQRGDGFIADNQRGVQRKGAGHTHPLPLTARKFVRVAVGVSGVEAHEREQFFNTFFRGFAIHDAMHQDRFANDFAHRHAGVEAGIGVLEDHLHLAAHQAQFFAFGLDQVAAFKNHTARGGAVKLQNGASSSGLAAARFANQAQSFAFVDLKRNAIHRMDCANLLANEGALHDGEVFDEIFNL